MSRIFDALQRSGAEQTGIEYPDMVSVATEVFEAPRRPGTPEHPADRPVSDTLLGEDPYAAAAPPEEVAPAPAREQDHSGAEAVLAEPRNAAGEFPSLQVQVTSASRLIYFTEPDSLAAEKFRFLGVRLRQLQQSRTLKRVLVTSTIPEEGKSLVSANLAGVLAQRKQKVLLIEGDLRRPVLAGQFGLGKLAGLAEWMQSGLTTPSNIYHLGGPGFWLMPAGSPPSNPLEMMQSGKLSQLMTQLAAMFDWIVVDSPPLLPLADTTVWLRMTDGALLVAREGKTEKAPLLRGLEILKKSDLLGVVLNGCSTPDHHSYYQRYASPENKVIART